MDVYEPHIATNNELNTFHSPEYINYMESISKKGETTSQRQCKLQINLI